MSPRRRVSTHARITRVSAAGAGRAFEDPGGAGVVSGAGVAGVVGVRADEVAEVPEPPPPPHAPIASEAQIAHAKASRMAR